MREERERGREKGNYNISLFHNAKKVKLALLLPSDFENFIHDYEIYLIKHIYHNTVLSGNCAASLS